MRDDRSGSSSIVVFFFSSRRRHTICGRDWSSDVCSSDLGEGGARGTLEITRREDFTGKLVLSGLTPATRYAWQARGGGETVAGEFVTAPAADARALGRFLWSGDLGGGGFCRPMDGGYRIFRTMALTRPDLFLFVGDTIYPDIKRARPGVVPGADFVATRPGQNPARHRYHRQDPPLPGL